MQSRRVCPGRAQWGFEEAEPWHHRTTQLLSFSHIRTGGDVALPRRGAGVLHLTTVEQRPQGLLLQSLLPQGPLSSWITRDTSRVLRDFMAALKPEQYRLPLKSGQVSPVLGSGLRKDKRTTAARAGEAARRRADQKASGTMS